MVQKVIPPKRQTLGQALAEQRNIMGAVILRDLRSRFFNHGLGFLIVPAFPFVHLLALLGIYGLFGRAAPFGDDLNLFLATGLIPTLTFMYVSRFMAVSLMENRQVLAYPIIGMLEVICARGLLEILSAIWMATAIVAVFYLLGLDPFPVYPVEAFKAFCVTLLLAISVGLIISLIAMVFVVFATVWALFLIVIYIASGSLFVVAFLPEAAVDILAWNPVLHCVEWLRTAYYPGYPDQVLDKTYLVSFAGASLTLGLLGERVLRAALLKG
ncbi:MAG: ABC transporter permease [Pseudomonadota bacterium]